MAIMYISEFTDMTEGTGGESVPVAQHPVAVANHRITTLSTTSQQSNAFATKTRFIRIVSDVDVVYVVGQDPTAAVTDAFLPANTVEHIGVKAGLKIAARTLT